MFRSPSRNQRSRGFKVKHVLQICLLLAVCFWLIYQVKHSHDKKKEFDANDVKISSTTQGGNELLNFGRKGLHPRVDEAAKIEKHGEEENEEEEAGGVEEEESKHDEEQEEEESKHDEEQEEEESKADEREDEGRGGGDDEIDENDQERAEGESDPEEILDEEKEREEEGDEKESEEKESEEKDDVSENEKETDDQDHDGGSRNAHEAREEHYKADDASSAVAHDTQTTGGEVKMEDFDENTLEQESKPNNNEEVSINHKNSKAEEIELAENKASPNVTDSEEKGTEISSSKSENSTLLNPPITTESNVQPEVSNNNSSEVSNNDSSEVANSDSSGVSNNDSSEVSTKPSDSDTKNGTETVSDSIQAQNAAGEGINTEQGADMQHVVLKQTTDSTTVTDNNQSDSEPENAGATTGESSKPNSSDATSEAKHNPESLISKENTDASQNEKPDSSNGSGETDENSASSSTNGSGDSIQQDPIDVSDSSIPQEEKEPPPTDLSKTPEIRTDASDKEGAAAE